MTSLMKKSLLIGSVLAPVTLLLLGGCAERTVYVDRPPAPPPAETVVVNEAPPPPQKEVIVEAPATGYYWVPGYWSWQGRWIWIGGRWTPRPHPRAVGGPGHWGRHGHGYIWIQGRWR